MLYTDNYQLNLPQTSDAVRVEDFNENTRAIDSMLTGMEISTLTAAEVWGANSVPTNVTIDGALSALVQQMDTSVSSLEQQVASDLSSLEQEVSSDLSSLEQQMSSDLSALEQQIDTDVSALEQRVNTNLPTTMGTTGKLLTAGSSGATWGKNPVYHELIGTSNVSKTGSLSSLCSIPTGWSTTNLVGIHVEADLVLTGIYNNYTGDRSSALQLGTIGSYYIYFYSTSHDGYDPTSVLNLSLRKSYWGVCGTDTQKLIASEMSQSGGDSSMKLSAGTLTVSNGTVTGVSSAALGFYTYDSGNYLPCAASCTGTVKFYAIREVS